MNEIKRCYLCGSNQLINRDGELYVYESEKPIIKKLRKTNTI